MEGVMDLPHCLGHLEDERVRGLAAHWLDARRGRGMPGRRDLDPTRFPAALPFVWLCDYEAADRGFRYRLAGERIGEANRGPLRGKTLRDVILPEAYPSVVARYHRVVDEPAIAHGVGAVYLNIGRPVMGERLVLPLATDGERPDAIVAITLYEWASVHPHRFTPNLAPQVTFTAVASLR